MLSMIHTVRWWKIMAQSKRNIKTNLHGADSVALSIDIPCNVENLQLPSPELLTYYKNLENRTLWLDSDVDESWIEFEKLIINWNRDDKGVPTEERKPIWLFCYSYGGSLDVNWSFISLIESSKTPIYAVNMGQACSAMCYIFLACHKRYAMPHSTFLIHQGSGDGFSGTYGQVVAEITEYTNKITKLYNFILEHTHIPNEVLEEKIQDEWYLDEKEALTLGVCDGVIDSIDEIL
jgi:ATP-dependent protease ClpP protease subunit